MKIEDPGLVITAFTSLQKKNKTTQKKTTPKNKKTDVKVDQARRSLQIAMHAVNNSQQAKIKKYIPNMSPP